MNRKFLAVSALLAALSFSAVSCGGDEPEESSVTLDLPAVTTEAAIDEEQDGTTSAEDTTAVQTSETTSADSSASSDSEDTTTSATTTAETETDSGNSEPSEEVTTEAPAEEVTEAPTEEVTEPAPDPEPTPEPDPEPPVLSSVTFSLDSLGSSAADIVNTLGEPQETMDALGCLSNGADQRIYIYDGLRICCYIQDDTPYIYQVDITNADYSTSSGVTVGSMRSDVEAAYGAGEEAGSYVIYYGDNGKELDVQYNGDTVASIYLYMPV